MTEKHRPLLSYYVPCFNVADYLSHLVASLQKLADNVDTETVEVLFIDDGSSDNTQAQLQSICDELPFARWTAHEQNLGVGEGSNTGLRETRGRYISRCDADDELDVTGTLKLIETLKSESPTAVFSRFTRVSNDNERESGAPPKMSSPTFDIGEAMWRGWDIHLAGIAVSRPFVAKQATPFRRLPNGEDILWRFSNFTGLASDQVVFNEHPVYRYLEREGSAANPTSDKVRRLVLRLERFLVALTDLGQRQVEQGELPWNAFAAGIQRHTQDLMRYCRKAGMQDKALALGNLCLTRYGASKRVRREQLRCLLPGLIKLKLKSIFGSANVSDELAKGRD